MNGGRLRYYGFFFLRFTIFLFRNQGVRDRNGVFWDEDFSKSNCTFKRWGEDFTFCGMGWDGV